MRVRSQPLLSSVGPLFEDRQSCGKPSSPSGVLCLSPGRLLAGIQERSFPLRPLGAARETNKYLPAISCSSSTTWTALRADLRPVSQLHHRLQVLDGQGKLVYGKDATLNERSRPGRHAGAGDLHVTLAEPGPRNTRSSSPSPTSSARQQGVTYGSRSCPGLRHVGLIAPSSAGRQRVRRPVRHRRPGLDARKTAPGPRHVEGAGRGGGQDVSPPLTSTLQGLPEEINLAKDTWCDAVRVPQSPGGFNLEISVEDKVGKKTSKVRCR